MAEDIRTGKLTPRELVESSVKLAQNIDNICKNVIPTQECPICLEKMEGPEKTPLKPNNPECRHLICRECATHEGTPSHCPICRRPYNELHSICVKCYGKSNKLPSWCCERGHQICPDCNQCDGICPLCLRDLQEERNTEKY